VKIMMEALLGGLEDAGVGGADDVVEEARDRGGVAKGGVELHDEAVGNVNEEEEAGVVVGAPDLDVGAVVADEGGVEEIAEEVEVGEVLVEAVFGAVGEVLDEEAVVLEIQLGGVEGLVGVLADARSAVHVLEVVAPVLARPRERVLVGRVDRCLGHVAGELSVDERGWGCCCEGYDCQQ